MKNIEKRESDLKNKLLKMLDRSNEILGEKMTLVFQLENGAINPMLAMAKLVSLDLEADLLMKEFDELKNEHDLYSLLNEINVDVTM
jgi:predicted KAP-like P-loop ATPase